MTQEKYQLKEMKSPCAICRKNEQRKKEQLAYGSLPEGIKPVDKPKNLKRVF